MEIFQELHCAVKSTYKHFTEDMSTDKSQPKEQINKANNKKDNFSVDTVNLILDLKMNFISYKNRSLIHMCYYLQIPSAKNDERNLIVNRSTRNDDITSDDDSGIEEIDEWINIENITRLEGNRYDSQGNSLRSSQSSSSSDIDSMLTFCSEKDIHSQLLLEADFYMKAFPRRAFPSYIENMLSQSSQR